MADRRLVCKDCGKEFLFTEGEQQFYAEKGFTNDPVRCKDCRTAKKQRFDGDNRKSKHESFNSPRIARY